jgi:hypothetical protein
VSEKNYELKVTLRYVEPEIWRRLRVPGDFTLGDLHEVLQIAMGWENYHMHQFHFRDGIYGVPSDDDWGPPTLDEQSVQLDALVRARSRFVYEYDFGDGWEHEIVVEKVEPAKDDGTDDDAVCLGGARACPPEDCGGPAGYAECVHAFKHPKSRAAAERREWFGDWDPEAFEVQAVNRQLGPPPPPKRTAKRKGAAKSRKASTKKAPSKKPKKQA